MNNLFLWSVIQSSSPQHFNTIEKYLQHNLVFGKTKVASYEYLILMSGFFHITSISVISEKLGPCLKFQKMYFIPAISLWWIICSPLLPGAFDLLIYTDKDLAVPAKWEESGPQFIANSEEVRLRSFTTTIHKVNTTVAYKKDSVP